MDIYEIAINPNATIEQLLIVVSSYPQAVLRNPCVPLLALEDPGKCALLEYRAALYRAIQGLRPMYKTFPKEVLDMYYAVTYNYVSGSAPEDAGYSRASLEMDADCIGDGVERTCDYTWDGYDDYWPRVTDYGSSRLVISTLGGAR